MKEQCGEDLCFCVSVCVSTCVCTCVCMCVHVCTLHVCTCVASLTPASLVPRSVSAYNAFIDDTRLTLDTSDTKVYEFEKGRLEVRTRCLVSKLHFARGYRDSIRKMCDGVMYFREDGAGNVKSEKRVTAFLDLSDRSSSVISCAGAIGSPQILEISGIGDFDRLKKIKGKDHSSPNSFTHHLKGVGENLHDHLQLRSVYKLNDEAVTLNKQVASVLGKIKIGLSYMFNRSGPLSMAPSQMGAFMKSDRRMRYPDMQVSIEASESSERRASQRANY